jgi:hypothetical protein
VLDGYLVYTFILYYYTQRDGKHPTISDILVLTPYRSLVEIGTNYAGAESKLQLASGALNFDMDTDGRRAIDLMVKDIKKNFNEKRWRNNGPRVVQRVLQSICKTKNVSIISLNDCLKYNRDRQPFGSVVPKYSCKDTQGAELSPPYFICNH